MSLHRRETSFKINSNEDCVLYKIGMDFSGDHVLLPQPIADLIRQLSLG